MLQIVLIMIALAIDSLFLILAHDTAHTHHFVLMKLWPDSKRVHVFAVDPVWSSSM